MLERKPRVLICTTIFPNREEINKGIYIYKQVKALSEIADLQVISPIPYCPKWLKIKSYQLYNCVPQKEVIENLTIYHPRYFVTPKVGRPFYGFFYALSIFKRVYKVKKEFQPDLFIGYWMYPDGFAITLLAKLFKLPIIVGARGCDVNDARSNYFRKKLIQWTIKASDGLMSVSEAMKREILNLGGDESRVAVIPNGVDEAFSLLDKKAARSRIKQGDLKGEIILFCGRLSHEKGIEYLIESLKILKERDILFTLLILGSGGLYSKINNMVCNYGLEKNVVFVDEVPSSEVKYYMNAADLLCLPSLREGWPNVVMEAMACGLPVIASNVGGVPEILFNDELGIMVEPANVKELAAALEGAIEKKWDREKIRSSIEGKTWDGVAERIKRFAISVLHK